MIMTGVPAIVKTMQEMEQFGGRIYPVRVPEDEALEFPFVLWSREGGVQTQTDGGGYLQPTMDIAVFSKTWLEADECLREIEDALSRADLLYENPDPPVDRYDDNLYEAYWCQATIQYKP